MSSSATTLNSARTLGAIPKTMRAGVYRDKGVVRVEEVPVPEVGSRRSTHQSRRLRHLRHRHQENLPALRRAAANSRSRTCRHGRCGRAAASPNCKPGDRVMSFHHIPCGNVFIAKIASFPNASSTKPPASPQASPPMAAASANTSRPCRGWPSAASSPCPITSASKKPPSSSPSTPS